MKNNIIYSCTIRTWCQLAALALLLGFVAALVFGCAGRVWQQPGRTSAQMHADLADCKQRAATLAHPGYPSNVGSRISVQLDRDDFIRDCMLGKGYDLQKPTR